MVLLRRQRLTVIALLLYWSAIFALTHIPPINIPGWVVAMRISDKAVHYLAYLVFVFLLWFAVSPDSRVNWRRAAVWWVLVTVVCYGVFDEWLQAYVGRDPDVMDFLADLAGLVTGLILFSIFFFWTAGLVITGVAIFILTDLSQANSSDFLPVTITVFFLLAYALFSLLWIRCMYHLLHLKAPRPKWLAAALVVPMFFLLSVESFSTITGSGFKLSRSVISAIGITVVVFVVYLVALLRRRFARIQTGRT